MSCSDGGGASRVGGGTGASADADRDSVMIPCMDCSYVFFYLMFHHLLPALPAIPVHDPRGRHVI